MSLTLDQYRSRGGSLARGTSCYVVHSGSWGLSYQRAVVWWMTPSGMVDIIYPGWTKADGKLDSGFAPQRFNADGNRRGDAYSHDWLDFDVEGIGKMQMHKARIARAKGHMETASDTLRNARGDLRASIASAEELIALAKAELAGDAQ